MGTIDFLSLRASFKDNTKHLLISLDTDPLSRAIGIFIPYLVYLFDFTNVCTSMSYLLGKGGSKIAEIRQMSGANIQISKEKMLIILKT